MAGCSHVDSWQNLSHRPGDKKWEMPDLTNKKQRIAAENVGIQSARVGSLTSNRGYIL